MMIGVAAAVALLGGAAAEERTVTMPGRLFSPPRLTVVAGDEVTWRNTDYVDHDVRAEDGSFDSGTLGRYGSFAMAFEAPGARPYLCTIHPFMRGEVDVVAALLRGPERVVLAGEEVRLEGRAVPGAAVTLSREGGGPVASAVAGADGGFAFTVTASSDGAAYRALTAAGASPPVALSVRAGVSAKLAVHPERRFARVRVRTVPAAPGLMAMLQRYSRERFAWRPAGHVRLDEDGRARFRVRITRRGRVRAVVSRRHGDAPLATTPVVRLRDGMVVRDPARPGGGGGAPHGDGAPHGGHS